ncbi:metalloregulator ArsR/SmtB family transcription factor [Actinoplanes sichuanensis]|uniref:ArsR/SmtB family transcription factor n=1 Tax=Actinoplanes sichuanensis TaxID=512349 RepID=A0ABW4AVI4_9ACTN|nr:metalloregulator ArsR/SmtB family transcription factor [Actinoplanes sichuanensis]BEL07006.1 metalloregulator ArsR/SmtB family transcription factor [Actinoplanes sichuanensis]
MTISDDLPVRLRALAHPVRLGILRELFEQGEVCACDLGTAFGVSQPTISEHLRVLRQAGLVQTRRDGTKICYSPDGSALDAVTTGLDALRPAVPAR